MENSLYRGVISGLLSVLIGIVWGQNLLLGESIWGIWQFYDNLHDTEPLIHPIVPYASVIDMVISSFTMSLVFGLFAVLVNAFLKKLFVTVKQNNKNSNLNANNRREVVMLFLGSIGLVAVTCGSLAIGWDVPSWYVYSLVNMFAIAPGSGLFTWSSIIIFYEKISFADLFSSSSNRFFLSLLACGPPIYCISFFPHYHSYVHGNAFFMGYKSFGTMLTPLSVIMILMSGYTMFSSGIIGDITSTLGSNTKQTQEEFMSAVFKSIRVQSFIISRALSTISFVVAIYLYGDWVFGLLDDAIIKRNAFLMLMGGSLLGRLIVTLLVEFHKEYVSTSNVILRTLHNTKSYLFRLVQKLMLLGSMGCFIGWWALAVSESLNVETAYTLAFFLGFTTSSVFFETIFTCLFDFHENVDDIKNKINAEFRLSSWLILSSALLAVMRFSTGFFGSIGYEIDYKFLTFVVSITSGCAAGIEMISLSTYLCG